jgi:peptide/nickel transport system substrate-binding protein
MTHASEHQLTQAIASLSRRTFLGRLGVFGVVAVATPTLVGCGSDADSGEPESSSGATSDGTSATDPTTVAGTTSGVDELRFLVAEPFWADWNPYGHTAVISYMLNANIFDRLVELEPDLTLRPGLATEWERIDDVTYEFKLREGVTFHNGEPFTAADVKASIELASGTTGVESARAANLVPQVVEVIDDTTVRLVSAEPFGPLLNFLAITDIVSAADVEGGVEQLAATPNGTGPYRLSRDATDAKTLTAFDDHYGGAPPVETVAWEYISDSQTRLNGLLAQQADIIDRVEPDQLAAVTDPKFSVSSVTSTDTQFLELRTNKPPFDVLEVRQAAAWAIDRSALVGLIGGQAAIAESHYAPALEFHTPQAPTYGGDPEMAKSLLEESGLDLPISAELVCSTGFLAKSVEVCELIKQQLDAVGFDITLTVLELGAWIDMLLGDDDAGEAFHGSWSTVAPDPDAALNVLYNSAISATNWDDSETDELLAAGRSTTSADDRRATYVALQERLWEQIPHIPLLHSDLSDARRSDLDGVALYPNNLRKFAAATVS